VGETFGESWPAELLGSRVHKQDAEDLFKRATMKVSNKVSEIAPATEAAERGETQQPQRFRVRRHRASPAHAASEDRSSEKELSRDKSGTVGAYPANRRAVASDPTGDSDSPSIISRTFKPSTLQMRDNVKAPPSIGSAETVSGSIPVQPVPSSSKRSEGKERDRRSANIESDFNLDGSATAPPLRKSTVFTVNDGERVRYERTRSTPSRFEETGKGAQPELPAVERSSFGSVRANAPLSTPLPAVRVPVGPLPFMGNEAELAVTETRAGSSQSCGESMILHSGSNQARETEPKTGGQRHQSRSAMQQVVPIPEPERQSFMSSPVTQEAPVLSKGRDIDISEIADQVSRVIARQLIIERERRGGNGWR